MNEILLWNVNLPVDALQQSDIDYLKMIAKMERPPVDWVWQEMDRVWNSLGLDNKSDLKNQSILDFYTHPIWVVNGVFTATDPESVRHRNSIAAYVGRLGVSRVADYGGGFGELAKKLAVHVPQQVHIDIVEPYPSTLGMKRVEGIANVHFKKCFDGQYGCVIAQDVLEHVEQPLQLTEEMVYATQMGGYLIVANCFYPAIKCHLPATFYLRHTFALVARGMGLKYVGRVVGANHALIFKKVGNPGKSLPIILGLLAKLLGPILNLMADLTGTLLSRRR